MTQCPEIDHLHRPESLEHLQQCEACRLLVDLSLLERPDPDACGQWEGLLSLGDELRDVDSLGLDAHLADCGACMVTYLMLAEESDAPPIEIDTRQGVAVEATYDLNTERKGGRRTIIVVAVVLMAAAVVLFIQRPEKRPSVAASDDETTTRVAASRPSVQPKKKALSPTPDVRYAEIIAQATAATQKGRQADALGYCSDALAVETESQETYFVCAIASCNLANDPATRLMAKLDSAGWQETAQGQCAQAPIPPDANEGEQALRGIVGTQLEASVQASKRIKYGESLVACEMALTFAPSEQHARIVCAIAACNLKLEDRARVHVAGLDSKRYQKMARQICLGKGISLE